MKPRRKPRKQSEVRDNAARQAAIAKEWGCDPRTVRNWEAEGAPLGDKAAMREWLEGRAKGNDELDAPDLKAAKLAKLLAETKRILFKLQTEQGEFTPNEVVDTLAAKWFGQVRSEFMALRSTAPTWAGLDAAQHEDAATEFVDAALERLGKFNA